MVLSSDTINVITKVFAFGVLIGTIIFIVSALIPQLAEPVLMETTDVITTFMNCSNGITQLEYNWNNETKTCAVSNNCTAIQMIAVNKNNGNCSINHAFNVWALIGIFGLCIIVVICGTYIYWLWRELFPSPIKNEQENKHNNNIEQPI